MIGSITRKTDFDRLRSGGNWVTCGSLRLRVLRLGEQSPLLVGFSIKRTAGNAVIRNRLRRRTRAAMAEVFHEEPARYSGGLCLAVVSPTADAITWVELKGQVAECFAKSGLLNE